MYDTVQVQFTGGTANTGNGCHGFIPAIHVERSDVQFPGLCLADAANGLRATDFVSSFPSGIHAGARYIPIYGREPFC